MHKDVLQMDQYDYLLMCLVKYATVNTSKDTQALKTYDRSGIPGWNAQSTYLELLTTYIQGLIPHSNKNEYEAKDGKIMLRLMADFWLGNNLVVKQYLSNSSDFRYRGTNPGEANANYDEGELMVGNVMFVSTLDRDASTVELTDLTMQGLSILLNHLLSRSTLASDFNHLNEGNLPDDGRSNRGTQTATYSHIAEHITCSEDPDPESPDMSYPYPSASVCPTLIEIIHGKYTLSSYLISSSIYMILYI